MLNNSSGATWRCSEKRPPCWPQPERPRQVQGNGRSLPTLDDLQWYPADTEADAYHLLFRGDSHRHFERTPENPEASASTLIRDPSKGDGGLEEVALCSSQSTDTWICDVLLSVAIYCPVECGMQLLGVPAEVQRPRVLQHPREPRGRVATDSVLRGPCRARLGDPRGGAADPAAPSGTQCNLRKVRVTIACMRMRDI